LCVYELGLVCSRTQLCHIGVFNDYIKQLHVFWPSSGCLERNELKILLYVLYTLELMQQHELEGKCTE